MKFQLTKLHFLIILIVGGLAFFGHYALRTHNAEMKRRSEALSKAQALQAAADLEREKKAAETVLPAPTAISVESKPAPEPENPAPTTYVVRKNDTLWSIAQQPEHFGQGHRWYDIWKANEDKIGDFDQIEPGTSLVIPLDKPDGYEWPETPEMKKQVILSHPEPRRRPLPAVN
jgi:hypothetical protein